VVLGGVNRGMDYIDQSAEIARLDREIDRLDSMGGMEGQMRAKVKERQRLERLQAIFLRKDRVPGLFRKMHAAADGLDVKAEGQRVADELIGAAPGKESGVRVMESDAEEFIEIWQELRPTTSVRIQAAYDRFSRNFGYGAGEEEANIHIGTTCYEKREGKWYRKRRSKNPAYWDQCQYFFIAPGPGGLAFIVVKQPRRLTSRLWQKACSGIFRDATGLSWYKDHPVVDGSDEEVYDRRASGIKPEPAYEIFIDGTWKRVK